jgi:protein TonB
LSNPPPAYPTEARRDHQEGRVLLRVLVSAEGQSREVSIDQSSGFSRLDEAAVAVVRNWRFIPGQRGDTAVEASVLVPIIFKLRS